MRRCFLIGQGCFSWLLIGWLFILWAEHADGRELGDYGWRCSEDGTCKTEFVCTSGTCGCPIGFVYDKGFCRKLCRGTNEGLVRHGSYDHQYQLYKNRYTNCSYVDGNLEITNLERNYDLGFLSEIREVSGYVLIVNVFSNYLNLTNLRIIRGKTLWHHSTENYSLYIALNHNPYNDSQGLFELQFNSLREIVRGTVYFHNNNLLCFWDTILWDDINPSTTPPVKFVFNSKSYKRQCGKCSKSCYNEYTKDHHCWGSGSDMCQHLNYVKDYCSQGCDGRCFGTEQNECCHAQCAAGCTSQKKTDCLSCKLFNNNGECVPFCPRMHEYDTEYMKWVVNPLGRYSFGSLCVEDCPVYLLKDEGACVVTCPPGKHADVENNECKPCDGPCPKTCQGFTTADGFLHSGNIKDFTDCTVIDGNLKILKVSFDGDAYGGFEGLKVAELDVLKSVREITGYLSVQEAPAEMVDMSFLAGLEQIQGRHLLNERSVLLIHMKITSLGLTSLKSIGNGKVTIAFNKQLCYVNQLDLRPLFSDSRQQFTKTENMKLEDCVAAGHVCHTECSNYGCWGPGPDKCLRCRNVRIEENNTCLFGCSDRPLLYLAKNKICRKCHEQCAEGCHGPGPDKCFKCERVKVISAFNASISVCMENCPIPGKPPYLYPDENKVCQPCDPTCADGCTGPTNVVEVGGCNTCELAINQTRTNGSVNCLPQDQESCPDGFYIQQLRSDVSHPLAGKQVCQPCDPLCITCNSPGTYVCPECRYYRQYMSSSSSCVRACPMYTYPDMKQCRQCHPQCLSGCHGPNNTDCNGCQNFKIVIDYDNYTFACVEKCPDDLKHLVEDTDQDIPTRTVCADDDHPSVVAMMAKNKDEERKKILTIAIPVCAGVILLAAALALFGYCWRQKERAKENTVKLTARMTGIVEAEPLTPTDAKPDLSRLKLIRESEMRRGGIIGSGAFGTVYKGFWIPDGENVKIPVAIKVLQEGTSSNQNQELLEEARVMASVEHPCCIRILAVCMASQMMLITQLMPLGCLLDYIRKHKDNTGSKALLNWCTQIARGMGYLEDRDIVHRDLAARNVLVQSAGQVKITDFGLAKLLDYNEDEYHAAGGKMPIKWLALECIQNRIFTHKSDVWSYGVTVWELFTYGARPYENVRARDVPDLLEKGERLPQPTICTIDVYMIMIKCWMLDAESRPSFTELAEEFAKMARDPGRYLVITGDDLKKIPSEEMDDQAVGGAVGFLCGEGDKLMRLPSYSYDKNDLARHLSVAQDGPEEVVEAEDYLQPHPTTPRSADGYTVKHPLLGLNPGASNLIREKRYGHLEAAGSRVRGNSMNGRYSTDPVKYTRDEVDSVVTLRIPTSPLTHVSVRPSPTETPVHLPVDEDDYLQPKSSNPQAYLDLIGDGKEYYLNEKQLSEEPAPDDYMEPAPVPSIFENPEYFEGDIDRDSVFMRKSEKPVDVVNERKPELAVKPLVKPKIAPKPRRLTDYYNDLGAEKAVREQLPLLSNNSSCSNNESLV